MKPFFVILFLFACTTGYNQAVNLPASFRTTYNKKGLNKKYVFQAFLKDPVLQADFNGDDAGDIAILVTEKATKKKGVLVMHGKTNDYFVFGAGTKFGEDSDNFRWANKWGVYNKRTIYERIFNKENGDLIGDREVRLKSPAIFINDEAARNAGIIYWNGKSYAWIYQGE